MDNQRRVLVVSYRKCLRSVAFTGMFDFEDLLLQWEEADLVEVPAHRGSLAFDVPRSAYQVLRTLGVGSKRSLSLTRLGRRGAAPHDRYDLVVFVTGSVFDLFGISWLADLVSKSDRVVAIALEAWPEQLQPGPVDLEPFDVFDQVYVGLTSGAKTLAQRHGERFKFLAPATNVPRFHPTPSPRSIMAVNPGRVHPLQHEGLLRLERTVGRPYLYDTTWGVQAKSVDSHRQAYSNTLSAADLLVCNYAKFDQPKVVGDQHEVPMRFFEGLAAGSVPVGVRPSEEAARSAGVQTAAFCDIPLSDQIGDLDELLRDHDRLSGLQRTNRQLALNQHDWGHRWESVLSDLSLDPTPVLRNRLESMAEEALKLE